MSPRLQRKALFINISNPAAGPLADVQKRAHSHAAREGHARQRRLRTAAYLSRNSTQQAQDGQGQEEAAVIERDPKRRSCQAPPGEMVPEGETAILGSPVSLLASDRRDPFASFATSLRPVEHFLLDHYVTVVIPDMSTNCQIFQGPEDYQRLLIEEWTRFGHTDAGFLNSLFLAACRHLSLYHLQQQIYIQLAIQYKLISLQNLGVTISAGPSSVKDSTIANVISLASDEVKLGDLVSSRYHLLGALKMVEIIGGLQTFHFNCFVELILRKFIDENGLCGTDHPSRSSQCC